jgi:hypothetical protein
MRIARQRRQVEVITHDMDAAPCDIPAIPASPRTSRMNRLVSRRLAHRGEWSDLASEGIAMRKSGVGMFRRVKSETGETVWHLSELHYRLPSTAQG